MSDPTTDDKQRAMERIYQAARTLWIWGLTSERADDAVKRFIALNPDLKDRIGGCTCDTAPSGAADK